MKQKLTEDTVIISPLEVRHFLLDIPVMKDSYQINAVKFSLKSLYPGNESTTSFDYVCLKNTIIGIAANADRITGLKDIGKRIISPTLLSPKIIKTGIIISAGSNWIELQIVKQGIPNYLRTFSLFQIEECLKDFHRLKEDPENHNLSCFLLCYEEIEQNILDKISENHFEYIDVYSRITKKALNDSRIFKSRKNKKQKLSVLLQLSIFILFCLTDFMVYKKAKSEKISYEKIKNEYQIEKEGLKFVENKTPLEKKEKVIEKASPAAIFSEIYRSSPTIRILSFNLNDNAFVFEAEKTQAIKVLENLTKSQIFTNVILHQAIPQEDGTERFLISGELAND